MTQTGFGRLLPQDLITTTCQKPVEIAIHACNDHKGAGVPGVVQSPLVLVPAMPHPHHESKPEPERRCGPRTQHLSPHHHSPPLQTRHPSDPTTTPGCPILLGLSFSTLPSSLSIQEAHFPTLLHPPHNCSSQPESLVRQPQTHLLEKKQRLPAQTQSDQGPKALPIRVTPLQDPSTQSPPPSP